MEGIGRMGAAEVCGIKIETANLTAKEKRSSIIFMDNIRDAFRGS